MRKAVVTGVSRLSGERENISGFHSHAVCKRMVEVLMKVPAKKRAHLRLRVDLIPWKEEWLRFSDGGGKSCPSSVVSSHKDSAYFCNRKEK
jgi:hypothetical protein